MIKIRSRLAITCVHCLTFSVLAGLVTLTLLSAGQPSVQQSEGVFLDAQLFDIHEFLSKSYDPTGYDPNRLDVIAYSDISN